MVQSAIYAMVYLGSALMVFNIYSFVRFARYVRDLGAWDRNNRILTIPIWLLVMFLLGYLAVGFLGKPALIVAGILFGGSIFVTIMYYLLNGITRQIVERESVNARLMASEETNRLKTSFLSVISHEMRTPMNVILGLDELELKNPALPPETREHLTKIGQSGRHLLGLINNVLDMNRIESGGLEVKREAFSLSEALGQVNAIAQTLCEEKGLDYVFAQPEERDAACLGDVMKLKHVLLSMLENAVKYTAAPGTVRFTVEAEPAGEGARTLRFSVADTGVGIDREFLPKLFHSFEQEDPSATNRYGGSGLSLSLAKQLVELMGGTIRAESEKGRGSIFTVTLPLPIAPDSRSGETSALPAAALAGRRVLLAEDVAENAEIVIDLLELEDVETDRAENGRIALELFERSADWYYDAVLMDLRMPVMDGLEAARRIRALDRDYAKQVPIIALTANAFESDVQASLEAGMNYHLPKPADAEMLYETLKRQIARAENERRRGN
jgi:signal transduction histidine kinase/AmiR/NasT family two-component response regulator